MRKLRVEYHVIDKCNLNCKSCAHFSNLVEEAVHRPLDKIKKDFARIHKLTRKGAPEYIEKITLLGGEPLLYKNLIPTLYYIKELFPHNYDFPLELISNGLLIPKMREEFFKAVKENEFRVIISIYKDFKDYDNIFKTLDDNGINRQWYGAYGDENDRPAPYFSAKWLHSHYSEEDRKNAQTCHWRETCTQLVDNKIYQCALIAYFKDFDKKFKGLHNFKITDEDYIDLDKINSYEELDAARNKVPHFCGHCRGSHAIKEKWGHTNKQIDEYVYDE